MTALIKALASLRVRFNPETRAIEVLEGDAWRGLPVSDDAPGEYTAFQLAKPERCEPGKGPSVCCTVCGGIQVSYAVWFRPLSGETGDIFGSWNQEDSSFCDDCEEGGTLLDRDIDPDRFYQLRAIAIAAEDHEAAVKRIALARL